MSRSTALSGSLRDLPGGELVSLLRATGQTGIVELRGAVPGFVGLDRGWLTVASAGENLSVEHLVVGSGAASPETFRQAQLMTQRGLPLMDALVRCGAPAERLEAVVREQIIGALFELVLPSDTWFVFLPGRVHPIGSRFLFSPAELVAEAVKRVEAWRLIADAIPSTDIVMRLAPEPPEAMVVIPADDWRVLALVDGHSTVADLIRSLGMSAFAVCAALHRLLVSGVVEQVADRDRFSVPHER
jgi:hypothetical protein